MLTAAQIALYQTKSPFENLGTLVSQKRGVLKGKYSFAVQGGGTGTKSLLDDNGAEIWLPAAAIITQVYIDVITAMSSTGNNGTIALTANTSGDLLVAVDADTLSGISTGVPIGSAATMVKLTATRQMTMAIATNALLAGRFNVFYEFVLSDAS